MPLEQWEIDLACKTATLLLLRECPARDAFAQLRHARMAN